MSYIISLPFGVDFMDYVSDLLMKDFPQIDFSSVLVIFPTKRARLFLNKYLSSKIKKSFLPPQIFSITEFIQFLTEIKNPFVRKITPLEAYWIIYEIISQRDFLDFPQYKESGFSDFFLWAKKIFEFLEEILKEEVPSDKLRNIEKNAQIGYDVPSNINRLLSSIGEIKEKFYSYVKSHNFTTDGLNYLKAKECIETVDLDFKKIYLAGFFALRKIEKEIFKKILEKYDTVYIIQEDGRWSLLEEVKNFFKLDIKRVNSSTKSPVVKIYECFDAHSQIKQCKYILKHEIDNVDKTCIVLPRPSMVIPLLFECISYLNIDYNVSLGYPLKITSVFSFIDLIMETCQTKREDGKFYVPSYIKLLTHPFIKNLNYKDIPSGLLRTFIENVEASLRGELPSNINLQIFIDLKDIEEEEGIFLQTLEDLESTHYSLLKEAIRFIHHTFFEGFESINNLEQFASKMKEILLVILNNTRIDSEILSAEVFNKFLNLLEEMQTCLFAEENLNDVFSIYELFKFYVLFETIPLEGSPLKGLQILGALETRNINFDNVIFLDVNEEDFPGFPEYESLIPEAVLMQLNIFCIKRREEIFRYYFKRLVNGAKKVYLLYRNYPQDKEIRSRFIEELIWEKEKEARKIGVVPIEKVDFNIEIKKTDFKIYKNEDIMNILKNTRFTASNLDDYIRCPIRFYFSSVLRLKELPQFPQELESQKVGIFLHDVLNEFYRDFKHRYIEWTPSLKKSLIDLCEFKFSQYFKEERGEFYLLKRIIVNRLNGFFQEQSQRQEKIKILFTEKSIPPCGENITLTTDYGEVYLEGKFDRVDERLYPDNSKKIIILDYKTGNIKDFKFNIEKIDTHNRQSIKKNISSIQLPFYLYLYKRYFKLDSWDELDASIYSLRTLEEKMFFEHYFKKISSKNEIMDIFYEIFTFIISEILNPRLPFERDTTDSYLCNFCIYSSLCKR